jgi:hypothetical protein
MIICDFCETSVGASRAKITLGHDPVRFKAWDLDLCPLCSAKLMDAIGYLVSRMATCGPDHVRIDSPTISSVSPGKT